MKTKLYLLQKKTGIRWPHYDVANSFVVRASCKAQARSLAALVAGDEGQYAWLLEENSTCELLTHVGEIRVIIQNFNAG